MRRLVSLAVAAAIAAVLVLPSSPRAAESEPSSTAPASVPAPPTAPATTETAPAAAPGSRQAPAAEPLPEPSAVAPAAPAQAQPAPPAAKTTPTPATTRAAAAPKARAAAPGSVTIKNFAFGPGSITVDIGDSVTWTNSDDVTHTASGNGGAFDTGNIPPGTSGSATFDEAGSFSYICKPHPFMKGTVVVRAASSGGGDTGDSSDSGTAAPTGSGSDAAASDAATGSADADSGPSLPSTGLDVLALAGLGLLLLGLGAITHRRAGAQAHAGVRNGW